MTAPDDDVDRDRRLWFGLGLICYLGLVWHFRWFIRDDAYITFRHVQHALEGYGLVWNRHEAVEGHSSLLWALLLWALGTLGVDLLTAARALSLAAGVATLALLARERRHAPTAALLGAWPPFAAWTMSGMETVAYALACLWAALAALKLLAAPRRGYALGAAGVALTMLRPDGVVVIAAIWLALGAAAWRERRLLLPLTRAAAVTLGALAAATLWRWTVYGDVVPNTVRAKSEVTAFSLYAGWLYLRDFTTLYGAPWLAWLAWVAVYRPNRWEATLLFAALAQAAHVVLVGGDFMPGFRFFVGVVPFMLLPLAGLIDRLHNRQAPSWLWWTLVTSTVLGLAHPRALTLVALPYLALGAVTLGALGHYLPALRRILAVSAVGALFLIGGVRTIPPDADQGWVVGRLLAEAVKDHWPPDTLTALATAGAFPYYSRLPCIDTLGLCDRHIARRSVRDLPLLPHKIAGHDKGDGAYVLARRPDVILLGGALGLHHPLSLRLGFRTDAELAADSAFARDYVPVRLTVRVPPEPVFEAFARVLGDQLQFIYFLRRDHVDDPRYPGQRLTLAPNGGSR